MNHYEKLIEYILNDETDKAREVFHNIVVNRSRQIYENMMDQDQSQLDELGNEINAEEQIGEEEMCKMVNPQMGLKTIDSAAFHGNHDPSIINEQMQLFTPLAIFFCRLLGLIQRIQVQLKQR